MDETCQSEDESVCSMLVMQGAAHGGGGGDMHVDIQRRRLRLRAQGNFGKRCRDLCSVFSETGSRQDESGRNVWE